MIILVKVVFMGTPNFSVPVLESLIENENYDVVGVVSQPDKKVGRKQLLTPSPISEVAILNNIPLLRIENIKNDFQCVLELNPDIIITCAYGQIIPQELLEFPKYGCINVHASLLPKFRGGAPIQRAIITGEEKTGITIMYMDKEMDSGDIIVQEELDILDSDNLETLTNRLSILGRDLLLKTLPSIINNTNSRFSQDSSKVTYAYNITHDEEHIDFNKSCRNVFNQVRGLSPNPGCYVCFHEKVIKVYNGYETKDVATGNAGMIAKIYKDGIGVNTQDYIYVITEIKLEGKKKMKTKDYLNGCKDKLIGEYYE